MPNQCHSWMLGYLKPNASQVYQVSNIYHQFQLLPFYRSLKQIFVASSYKSFDAYLAFGLFSDRDGGDMVRTAEEARIVIHRNHKPPFFSLHS